MPKPREKTEMELLDQGLVLPPLDDTDPVGKAEFDLDDEDMDEDDQEDEVSEEDDDNPDQESDEALPDDEEEETIEEELERLR